MMVGLEKKASSQNDKANTRREMSGLGELAPEFQDVGGVRVVAWSGPLTGRPGLGLLTGASSAKTIGGLGEEVGTLGLLPCL